MSKLDKYMEWKRKVKQAQQEADKAEGALEQIGRELKKDFGCSTLQAVKKKLKILEKQVPKAKAEFENAVEKFKEKWPDN